MPDPNIAHFQAGPELLLEWLNNNLLKAGTVTNVANPPGTAWVVIAPEPVLPFPPRAVNASGRPIDVYTLKTNAAGAGVHNAFRAYVCNYTAGGHESVVLGAAADYMFTINLNGCTFGVGPRSATGQRVSHANSGGNTLTQRNQTWTEHGVAPNSNAISMLEPAEYRRLGGGGNLNATVFGIRRGLEWRYYFQLYTAVGQANYQMHGVFPIRTT